MAFNPCTPLSYASALTGRAPFAVLNQNEQQQQVTTKPFPDFKKKSGRRKHQGRRRRSPRSSRALILQPAETCTDESMVLQPLTTVEAATTQNNLEAGQVRRITVYQTQSEPPSSRGMRSLIRILHVTYDSITQPTPSDLVCRRAVQTATENSSCHLAPQMSARALLHRCC